MQESIKVCDNTVKVLSVNIEKQCEILRKKLGEEQYMAAITSIKDNIDASANRLHRLKNKKLSALSRISVVDDSISDISDNTLIPTVDHTIRDDASIKISVEGDGNCFYRCIAYILYDNQELHASIRNSIAEELSSNSKFYREFVDGDFHTHLNNVKLLDGSVDSWATEAEIIATSYRFDKDIFVKTIFNGQSQWQRYPPGECNHNKEFICVNYSSNHLNFVKTSHRPCICNLTPSPEVENLQPSIDANIDNMSTKVSIQDTCSPETEISQMEVINLSSKKLTTDQISLLKKGLKFVPTRQNIDFTQLLTDLQTW